MGWHRRRYRGRNLERAVTIADIVASLPQGVPERTRALRKFGSVKTSL